MNTYRIVYWFNSCTTECYLKALTEQGAIEKFKTVKGDRNIVNIEMCI